jgi:hypothetical protein
LHNRLQEVAAGQLSLDEATRTYVRDRLGFRFAIVADPKSAFELERTIQRGESAAGRPLLNGIDPPSK